MQDKALRQPFTPQPSMKMMIHHNEIISQKATYPMNLYKKAKGVSVYFAAHCPDLRKNKIRPGSSQTKSLLPFQTNKPSKKHEKCQLL